MSDAARKRVLAVVKTKKQVVKLYAVTKWARDAGTVQKCMVCFLLHHPFSKARTQMLKSAPPLRDRIEHNSLPDEPEPTIRRCHRRAQVRQG
jgi:mediator of RNA polymerase II transcription subunit 14